MGIFAASTLFSNDTGPAAGAGLESLALNQKAILELEGAQDPISCTIADGSISPTAAYVIVDTEGGAAADDLDVISPVLSASENLHVGMIVNLKAADSGRVITVKNSGSANGINTYDGNDYVLSPTYWLKLQLRSGKWYEVEGRAMETALAAATAAAAASTPATTTARGIGRVATSADLVDGATINNGPAFLAAGVHTSVAAAAGKVPVADADGSLNSWAGARYAACSTAAATAAKAADLANFQLVKGSRVFVTFANSNTVAGALTLNVNGTGAKAIYNELGAVSSSNPATFTAGIPIEFIYDGTKWTYRKYQDEFAKVSGGAPMFTCRAWVNFNGTGTIAIRASGNVSSITDNGVADYTANFTVAMPDTNFATVVSGNTMSGSSQVVMASLYPYNASTSNTTTTSVHVVSASTGGGGTPVDLPFYNVAVFR